MVGNLWRLGRTPSQAEFEQFFSNIAQVGSQQNLAAVAAQAQAANTAGSTAPGTENTADGAAAAAAGIPRVASIDFLRKMIMNQSTMPMGVPGAPGTPIPGMMHGMPGVAGVPGANGESTFIRQPISSGKSRLVTCAVGSPLENFGVRGLEQRPRRRRPQGRAVHDTSPRLAGDFFAHLRPPPHTRTSSQLCLEHSPHRAQERCPYRWVRTPE